MIECVLGPLSGISVFASDAKADWNCLFKILAFSVGSVCNSKRKPQTVNILKYTKMLNQNSRKKCVIHAGITLKI
jgi:hypothetical protein